MVKHYFLIIVIIYTAFTVFYCNEVDDEEFRSTVVKRDAEENKKYLEEINKNKSHKNDKKLKRFAVTDDSGQTWVKMNVKDTNPVYSWANKHNIDIKNIEYMIDSNNNVLEIRIKNEKNITIEKITNDWKDLQGLSVQKCELKTIGGIEKLDKLVTLDLSNNNIRDISHIQFLSEQITHLNLSSNEIKTIDALSGFKKLVHLNLKNNRIEDINALENTTNIDTLFLSKNNIEDIGVLKNYPYLIELRASENRINDISVLSGLKTLRILYLSKNNIKNIMPLEELHNLEELMLYDNPVLDRKDITVLSRKLGLKDIW